jgi:hypothetical protein
VTCRIRTLTSPPILLVACLALGCVERTPTPSFFTPIADTSPRAWTHLNFNNDPAHFQFAIVGDRTGRHRPGVFEKGIAKLNLLAPEFVMSVGDLIEGYTKDEPEIDQQWDEIESFTARLESPFFYVPGNHDISNDVQAKKWRSRFGDAYYHFVYRDVLFLCLNTSDPEQKISSQQVAFVADVLKKNANVRWTCVFMHEPLWDYKKDTGWAQVEALLLDRPYTIFAGHYHTYTKYVRHDRRYFVLATTGGGMKGHLASPELGSFDHVTWVTMTGDGPRVANIELDAIHDEDVRTEATANLINRVLRAEVLKISPVLVTDETFQSAPVTLSFTNDADVPMTAEGSLPAEGQLRAAPESFSVTVPPKSKKAVELQISAEKPVKLTELKPLAVKWSASYQLSNHKLLRVPREDLLAVECVSNCRARTAAVIIDGKLDEWATMPLGVDSDYRFAVEHDDQFVYVAVKASDDRAVLNPLKEPWSQDGIEVRFDARPDPLRSQGRGRGEFRDILVISMSPGETPDKMVHYGKQQLPPGVRAVCVKTDTGHATEIAIPLSYLNERQGGAWEAFRLNVAVNDFDEVAGPLKASWWRPDWRSPSTYAGSGTFRRK